MTALAEAPPIAAESSSRRKRPQQPRSAQTVERIKRAMLEICESEGYAAASTNRVAQRAGVNIASLYQYFPNRQAIALALIEDSSAELARSVNGELRRIMTLPMTEGLVQVLDMLVGRVSKQRASLLLLPEKVPELRQPAEAMSLETLSHNTGLVYLRHHLGEVDEKSLRRKLYFVQHMSMGVIRRYAQDPPPQLPRKRFVVELAGMIVGYLQAGSGRSRDA